MVDAAQKTRRSRVLCRFASSREALERVAAGHAHIAGIHLHNTEGSEANVAMADSVLDGYQGKVVGFSMMAEGLMVAWNNPLGIRSMADLARPEVRLVNREPGAALRILLDDHLGRAGIPGSMITGDGREVSTHNDGAQMVVCNGADAALGLRATAGVFGLDFVPETAVRCDLVIPGDLMDHPTVKIMMDVLQSRAFPEALRAIPGYESRPTGRIIAEF